MLFSSLKWNLASLCLTGPIRMITQKEEGNVDQWIFFQLRVEYKKFCIFIGLRHFSIDFIPSWSVQNYTYVHRFFSYKTA